MDDIGKRQKEFRERAEAGHEKQRARLEENAEYQRRAFQMTKEEKARDAKERLLKNVYEHQKQMGNDSYADAERRVERLVGRYVREIEK